MVRRASLMAPLLLGLLGCQTILPLADGEAGPDGGTQTDGTVGGGDPQLLDPIPPTKPGCDPAALPVTVEAPQAHRATRRAPIRIEYAAPTAARVEFRSDLPGVVVGDADLTSGSVEFDFADAGAPIWRGTYTFTVVAFDAQGCLASAGVELRVAGDLLIGTRAGAIWFLGSDGRVLAPVALPIEDPSAISALAARRDPLRIVVGFDHPDGEPLEPALAELDVASGSLTPFAIEDIQGTPLYRSGKAPRTLTWDPTESRLWTDGANDNLVHAFFPDGRHDRSVALAPAGGLTTSILGFFANDRLFGASEGERDIFTVAADDRVSAFARLESAFSRVRHLAPGDPAPNGEATVLVLLWDGNPEFVERYTVFGQFVDRLPVNGLSTQIVASGDAVLARSTAGGIQVFPLDGGQQASLFESRAFREATGEDFINLGAMIELR